MGTGGGLHGISQMLRVDREKWWPNLTRYAETSPATATYNCVAWAAGDTRRWWEPDADGDFFWPNDVPREYDFRAYRAVFERMGYQECKNVDLEPGYEKVALYLGSDGEFTHVARQLPDGRWTSKLGAWDDIDHADLNGLVGPTYGSIGVVLRKPT